MTSFATSKSHFHDQVHDTEPKTQNDQSPSKRQQQGSHPKTSVWVDASAGTGKTKVLTDRVLRLLLSGTAPGKILCLTFTKAAAAEMQSRIMENLSLWSSCPLTHLTEKLTSLLGSSPAQHLIQKARSLFFDLIDDPYGLKVQTIHGFCQKLLARFPTEAGLNHTTTIMTDGDQAKLLQNISHTFLISLSKNPDLKEAFDHLTKHYKPTYILTELLTLLLTPKIRQWADTETFETFKANLEMLFHTSFLEATKDPFKAFDFQTKDYHQVALALKTGSKTDQKKSDIILDCLERGFSNESFSRLYELFFTKSGDLRKTFATKPVITSHPFMTTFFEQESQKLAELDLAVKKRDAQYTSWALGRILLFLAKTYEAKKQNQGLLDYDDLIAKSAHLLSLHQGVSWVLFKLDGGIDHILVDEAQDTSPDQWQIIMKLAEDFFTGESARQTNRTLFVVGDQKQSIYGFQGAAPDLFVTLRHFFERKIKQARQNWTSIALDHSFRSSPLIMKLVETVFLDRNLGILGDHISYFTDKPGTIELWPLYQPLSNQNSSKNNDAHSSSSFSLSPSQKLARDIADDIYKRLHSHSSNNHAGVPATVRAGDILILVQRRSNLLFQLIRAIKKKGIPIAGPDRFSLTDHIITQDLLALGAFISFPQDDYALACLLKSPLFGFDDDDLLAMPKQKSSSLFDVLSKYAPTAHKTLTNWIRFALHSSVYEFYEHVLKTCGKWQNIRSLYNFEADDVIDEFLLAAQDFDTTHYQSLSVFVEVIRSSSLEVKRDFSQLQDNAVRIMTVHGAKGLQAPIVYLPDTVRVPREQNLLSWIHSKDQSFPVWCKTPQEVKTSKHIHDNQDENNNQDQDLAEYYRLLYVALTRAESHLIISGFETQKQTDPACWYNCIEKAFQALANKNLHNDNNRENDRKNGRLIIRDEGQQKAINDTSVHDISRLSSGKNDSNVTPLVTEFPSWLFSKAPFEVGQKDPQSPSAFIKLIETKQKNAPTSEPEPIESKKAEFEHIEFKSAVLENTEASLPHNKASQQEGTVIHKYIEYLCTTPKDKWDDLEAALSSCSQNALNKKDCFKIAKDFVETSFDKNVLCDQLQFEVPIMGVLDMSQLVNGLTQKYPHLDFSPGDKRPFFSGQIDCLCFDNNEIKLIDFKTSKILPESFADCPFSYKCQMYIYKGLLEQIYPQHHIHCELAFVRHNKIMRIYEKDFEKFLTEI